MCLLKTQVAVYPGGCLYIHFKRMKSAACQGASFYHDFESFSCCPVRTLAVATIMHGAPSEFLLDQIPRDSHETHVASASSTPLLDLVQNPPTALATSTEGQQPNISVPGIQAYVNRVLQTRSSKCSGKVTRGLTSHSFRRGSAQNTNADSNISPPWIMDRGGWSMSSISKAFNYIVSTTHEDQKVAKPFTGWRHDDDPHLPTLRSFDTVVAQRVGQL
ncbi:hypothetical protein PHMEG_00037210, partial [Phytophthora megakarya]